MGIHLAGIVAAVSVFPASLTFLLRHRLPLLCSLALAHVSLVGFAVALATTDQFAAHSTQLLSKVCAAIEEQYLRLLGSTAPAMFHTPSQCCRRKMERYRIGICCCCIHIMQA